MTPWKHKNPAAIRLVSFLVYEYFIFSPAGIATQNRNIPLILGVTALMIAETIVLVIREKAKSANAEV